MSNRIVIKIKVKLLVQFTFVLPLLQREPSMDDHLVHVF